MHRAAVALALMAAVLPARAAEFAFKTAPDGKPAVQITGEIKDGDDHRLIETLKRGPMIKAVILDSPGGLILPALQIGRLVHEMAFETMVLKGATCASACADIWIGAAHRYLAPGSRLGFHGIYGNDGKTVTMTGAGNGLVGAYLARLGYSDSVVVMATAAQPTEMEWIDPLKPFHPSGLTFETINEPKAAAGLFGRAPNPAAPSE